MNYRVNICLACQSKHLFLSHADVSSFLVVLYLHAWTYYQTVPQLTGLQRSWHRFTQICSWHVICSTPLNIFRKRLKWIELNSQWTFWNGLAFFGERQLLSIGNTIKFNKNYEIIEMLGSICWIRSTVHVSMMYYKNSKIQGIWNINKASCCYFGGVIECNW